MHIATRFQIIIPIWFINLNAAVPFDTDSNNTEVFVAYSGHSDVKDDLLPKPDILPEVVIETTHKPEEKKVEDEVVFIPNEKPVFRNEDDYLENNPVEINDMMNHRKIGDVIKEVMVTEAAKEDILFISGKNNENGQETHKKSNKHTDTIKTKDKEKRKRLDCRRLDCDNAVKSVCGGKMEDKKWKYRSFLNECFFRKVNCAFKNPDNRYKLVDLDKCSHIGGRSPRKPPPQSLILLPSVEKSHIEETRRSFSSRRSLTADMNGQSCSHPCPVMCTEKYEPQCAVSNTGQRRTFLNHCKMDYHSCLLNVAWYIRPLSECVGGKKADVQQNRGFIAWMQKVGIVDGRGRLTLNKGVKGLRPRFT